MNTFAEVTRNFIAGLSSTFGHRSNDPLSQNTKKLYTHCATRASRYLGDLPLTAVTALHVKNYISELKRERLAPTSINVHYQVLRSVVESVRDELGDPVRPANFNLNFINLPSIKTEKLHTPIASVEDIEKAISVGGQFGVLIALLAGTGIRISEATSLTINGKGNHYDTALGAIVIRHGKTDSAERTIPLDSGLNAELIKMVGERTGKLFRTPCWTVRRQLEELGLPPFHAYRRFRTTHLRRSRVVEEIEKYLLGHARSSITDRYSRLTADVAFTQREVSRAGLGFSLTGLGVN